MKVFEGEMKKIFPFDIFPSENGHKNLVCSYVMASIYITLMNSTPQLYLKIETNTYRIYVCIGPDIWNLEREIYQAVKNYSSCCWELIILGGKGRATILSCQNHAYCTITLLTNGSDSPLMLALCRQQSEQKSRYVHIWADHHQDLFGVNVGTLTHLLILPEALEIKTPHKSLSINNND